MTRVWPVVKIVVGVGIVVALVVRLGSRAVVDGLASIGVGSVLAALCLGLLTTAAGAARWCIVARALGVALPLPVAVTDCYRAVFLNSVLPAGVLGDVHRAVGYGRRIGDVGRGVRIVALERVTGQLAIVVLGLCVLVGAQPALLGAAAGRLGPDDGTPGWFGPAGSGWAGLGWAELLAAVVAVTALGVWLARAPRAAGFRAAVRAGVGDARGGVFARGTWPALLGLSVVALSGYLTLFVVAARAAGTHAPLADLLPLLVLGLLAMVLPLNVGGFGPREGVTAVAFGAVGLGAPQGLATAVIYGVLSLVACLPGAVVLILSAARTAASRRLPIEPTVLERSAA